MKVLNVQTTKTSCTITARFSFGTLIGTYTDNNAHISFIKIKTLQIMKKYIIQEDLLSKVKALLKVGKEKNIVIEFNEVGSIMNKLDNLQEQRVCHAPCKAKPKGKYFYDVSYTGVSPITDQPYHNQVLIFSEHRLFQKDVEYKVMETFQLTNIKVFVKEIQEEEFELIKEDISLLSEY
jgi:NACalpha-BTF3-like transcription factor